MHVEHQKARERRQHFARGQTQRVGFQPFAQRDLQAIGQKAHQNVRLNARLDVVADRAQAQVAFQGLEDAFDLAQLQVAFPERSGLLAGAKGAQQGVAVACLSLLQFIFEQFKFEGAGVHRRARFGQGDLHEAPRAAGGFVRGAELVQERVAFPGALGPLRFEISNLRFERASAQGHFLGAAILALDQHVDFVAVGQEFDLEGAAQGLPG